MCENQPISSHQFAERLKQCCTHNSDRLLQMLVVEKDRSKSQIIREGIDLVDRYVEDWVCKERAS